MSSDMANGADQCAVPAELTQFPLLNVMDLKWTGAQLFAGLALYLQ